MIWIVEYEDAYDDWDVRTRVEEDTEIRLATLEYMLEWRQHGPPRDAAYDDLRETWSCAIPGTPVIVEYVMLRYLDPPVVIVRGFLGAS